MEARKEVQFSALITTRMPNSVLKLVCVVETASHMLIAYEPHKQRMSDVLENDDGSLSGLQFEIWVRISQLRCAAAVQFTGACCTMCYCCC